MIFTNQAPRHLERKYINKVKYVRNEVKGQHPLAKIRKIRQTFNKHNSTVDDAQILNLQAQFQIDTIKQNFEYNYRDYWTCDIQQLKFGLVQLKLKYDIKINTLTANCEQNTEFLLNTVLQLGDVFDDRLCYTLDHPQIKNKTQMLQKYLKENNLIGDGNPDMKAAKDCNCIGIGVDNAQGGQYHINSKDMNQVIQLIDSICQQK